ncbi:MAG: phosphatase PAP2 family protein, partial [Sphingomonas sp.]
MAGYLVGPGGRLAWPLCLSAAVAALALAIRFGLIVAADRALLLALAPPPALVPWLSAITWLGDSLTRGAVTVLAVLALLIRRDWRRALALVLTVAGGAALNSGVKLLVARPRPDLLPHLDAVTSASFPSGHAANGAILYLALALLAPPRWRRFAIVGAVMLVCAIGVSRVALAVHWPSDVIAGWCLGLGWVLLWRPGRPCPGRSAG